MPEEDLKPANVDFDEILVHIGLFGKFQFKTFIWLLFPIIMASMHANNYIFSAADTKYRCQITGCDDNKTEFQPHWLENAAPIDEKCSMYATINATTFEVDNATCPADWFDSTKKIPCDGYIFEKEGTFIEELDIPCEDWKRTLVGTMHSAGNLLALPAIGYFSDRFGRRKILVVTGVIEGILGIIKGFSINYSMFVAFEFLEPLLGSGSYSCGYVLAVELLAPSTRLLGGALINISFGIGQVLVGVTAWLMPYWRTYIIVIYIPSLFLIAYFWLIEESSRWLLSKKRYQEVIDNLNLIAKTNKKELNHKSMEALYYNAENASKFNSNLNEDGETIKSNEESPIRQFFRSKILILRVIVCSFWWITCIFSFYGLSINSVFLSGSIYLNYGLIAVMEIPANITGYFLLKYFGRKKTLFVAFIVGGISCISVAFVPDDLSWLSLTLYLVGKFFVTIAFDSVYLYTSELFPTTMRHSLLAFCSMMGRIGSVLAPQTPLLALYMDQLPSLLFGSTCLISALLMITSPETLNHRLPETIKEAENIPALKIK